MSASPTDSIVQVRSIISEVLAGRTSKVFLGRIDLILSDWSSGTSTAAEACNKIQKMVSLFIDENKAKEISSRCAPIVMRESSPSK